MAALGALATCSPAHALTIVPTFDATITSDPQAAIIEATINAAIAVYEANFTDPITVAILFSEDQTISLGESWNQNQGPSYLQYRAALVSHATTTDDATAIANLPNTPGNPVNGNQVVVVNTALVRALGMEIPPAPQYDGGISLKTSAMNLSAAQTDPGKYSLFAVVSHEINEVLGFNSALDHQDNGAPPPTGPIGTEDLFRYAQNGARSFTTDVSAAAYFSIDGVQLLARFNQTQGGDFHDWYGPYSQTPPQVQDAAGTPGATPELNVELRVLDVIGYTRGPGSVWVDFNYSGSPQNGTYNHPFLTLHQGTNGVPMGGTILLKPGVSAETMRISEPMRLMSIAGPATIGR
jgi:hypothetical protein